MRILLLQLKRIGDLVLTTPALCALRAALPRAPLTLGVAPGAAGLLPAIPELDEVIVFGTGRGFTPWQQVLTGPWDACLDFTGTDRSALATALSRATKRATFSWVKKKRLRALAYDEFVDSSVRERHTADHYGDLLAALRVTGEMPPPQLKIPEAATRQADGLLPAQIAGGDFVLLHPGTARAEKYWLADRWAELALRLIDHGHAVVFTSGPDSFEHAHLAAIRNHVDVSARSQQPETCTFLEPPSLTSFAALVRRAKLVVSCDTAVVHLAAAFARPQVALFGPTNPFHWRPRHAEAVVISATTPDAPLATFESRMRGAAMERISTAAVIRATESLLSGAKQTR